MIKTPSKVEIKENVLILTRNIYQNLQQNITLKGERLNTFSLKIGKKARMFAFMTLAQHNTGTSRQYNKSRNGNKRHTIQKGRNKTGSICT